MSKYIITPWRYHTDLLDVRRHFYQLDNTRPDERRRAVDRVMAWKMRGNLPHAVESTALLTDAILHHAVPDVSTFSTRAVYSAAFTRFVTGFCDIGRNKERSLEPSSMLDIAKQIGMPVQFVALRHEATHEELPAMQRLTKATDEALQWLWNVYWSRLEESEPEAEMIASLPRVRTEAKQILRTFRSARKESLQSKKRSEADAEIRDVVASSLELVGKSSSKMETFTDVLVQERLLSPSRRQLGSSLQGAFLIWDHLLQAIVRGRKAFVRALVKSLLAGMASCSKTDTEDAESEALALWTLHVISAADWVKCVSERERSVLCKDAMKWCCVHPSRWTYWLGTKILEQGGPDFEQEWTEVFQASQLPVLEDKSMSSVTSLSGPQHDQGPQPAFSEELNLDLSAGVFKGGNCNGWQRMAVRPTTSIGVV